MIHCHSLANDISNLDRRTITVNINTEKLPGCQEHRLSMLPCQHHGTAEMRILTVGQHGVDGMGISIQGNREMQLAVCYQNVQP